MYYLVDIIGNHNLNIKTNVGKSNNSLTLFILLFIMLIKSGLVYEYWKKELYVYFILCIVNVKLRINKKVL